MLYNLQAMVYECRPKSYKNKSTGKEVELLELTLEQSSIGSDGYKVKDVDTVQFELDKLTSEQKTQLLESPDKYITLNYEFRSWRDANTKQMTSAMMLANYDFKIHDKNPNPIQKTTSHDVKKSA